MESRFQNKFEKKKLKLLFNKLKKNLKIVDVVHAENTSESVKHSADVTFSVEKYEIV